MPEEHVADLGGHQARVLLQHGPVGGQQVTELGLSRLQVQLGAPDLVPDPLRVGGLGEVGVRVGRQPVQLRLSWRYGVKMRQAW